VGTFESWGLPLSSAGQEQDYVVELHWPDNGNHDINYAGKQLRTTVNVDAIASQFLSVDKPPQPQAA
jgi:hypothetical protein